LGYVLCEHGAVVRGDHSRVACSALPLLYQVLAQKYQKNFLYRGALHACMGYGYCARGARHHGYRHAHARVHGFFRLTYISP